MPRYSCTLKGICEDDRYGRHTTLVECQANCQPLDSDLIDDVVYDILTLNLEDAEYLAPSDISTVLLRATGFRFSLLNIRQTLLYVLDGDYINLWQSGEVARNYVRTQLQDELDLVILDTIKISPKVQPDWTGLRNKVSRGIRLTLQEGINVDVERAFINMMEENRFNLERLVKMLQRLVVEHIYVSVTGEYHDVTDGMLAGVAVHWDYILEMGGSVIPYQQYLVRD